MQIAIRDDGSAATVTMTGRLDTAGAKVVARPLATLSGSKSALFLDMAAVTFLASSGLRQLVLATKALARRGGRLMVSTICCRSKVAPHPRTGIVCRSASLRICESTSQEPTSDGKRVRV